MTTVADVRRIAAALPDVEASADGLIFAVRRGAKARGFAWAWRERVAPRRARGPARVPNPGVFAVRVATVAQRDLMIAAEPAKFCTEPHDDGFPAVLVRLDAVSVADVEVLLAAVWRGQAEPPRRTRRAHGPSIAGRLRAGRRVSR
ncbi:hypothetical protein tb265_40810 [Gemmatimonadetes bacterium T265]|nr:hypothetical protein tb265_40810 [Gemmatimonadetes bacterium T265]